MLNRPEIVKRVWDYIKKNNRQDKHNKRLINLDPELKGIFGDRKQISMFEIAKELTKHLRNV